MAMAMGDEAKQGCVMEDFRTGVFFSFFLFRLGEGFVFVFVFVVSSASASTPAVVAWGFFFFFLRSVFFVFFWCRFNFLYVDCPPL